MTIKPTISELLEKNATLDHDNGILRTKDDLIRREFAKAFSLYQEKSPYDHSRELRLPTWEEIFVEIGKLLAARTFYDLEGNVSELEHRITQLEQNKNDRPNLLPNS